MSQQLQITGGAKVRSLEGVITGSTGVLGSLPINGANGIPQLDSNGKILVSQLPNSVMEYKGTWNVTTNTPYLVNGTGNTGDVYLVEGAATGGTSHDFGAGSITFYNGDQVIYSGSIWQRGAGSSGTVTSVAITESGDALTITGSPITNSGTINIGFAGTSAQYVAGNGALVTFPALTGYVPYTGATATLDMGSFDVNARGFKVNGTAGSGHVDFKHQSGTPTGSASSTTLYADTNGDMAWKNDHNYITTFDSHSNTADRIYTLPNASGTVALTSDLSAYVPTSRTLTINGVTYDLSANRSWTISTGISGSGTTNYIPKFTGSTSVGNSTLQELSAGWLQLGSSSINTSELDIVGNTGAKVYLYDGFGSATIQSYYNDAFTILTQVSGQTTNVIDYNYATKTLSFQTNGNNTRLNITSSGNIGIGNTNDTYKLDVTGTGRFSGQLTLGSTITNGTYTYTLPGATGTLALLSDIPSVSGYVPYTGAGSNVDLGDYTLSAANLYAKAHGSFGSAGQLYLGKGSAFAGVVGYSSIAADQYNKFLFITGGTTAGDAFFNFNNISVSTTRTYTFPNTDGTIALTTDLSSYVPTSRTLTINGTTYDLSANRSWTVSGSQWTTSGSDIYYNTGNVLIGTTTSTGVGSTRLQVSGTSTSAQFLLTNTGGHTAIYTTGTDSYITRGTGGFMAFGIAPQNGSSFTEHMRIAADGNVGIGIVPSSWAGGTESALQVKHSSIYSYGGYEMGMQVNAYYNAGWKYIGSNTSTQIQLSDGNIIFKNAGAGTAGNAISYSERMRITSAGNVGINGTPTSYSTNVYFDVIGNTTTQGGIIQSRNSDNSVIGSFITNVNGLNIRTETTHPMLFSTAAVERMRITSGGSVCVNTTTASYSTSGRGNITIGGTSNCLLAFQVNGTDRTYLFSNSTDTVLDNAAGTGGVIVLNGSGGVQLVRNATSWTSYSDLRLKNINSNIENAVDKLLTLRTINFSWKSDKNNKENLGLIAQDVEKVFPQVIDKNKLSNVIDKQLDETEYLGVRYTELIPVLVKAIQELKAEIDELKNK